MANFFKVKEGENYNHRNTFKYFEDYNLSLAQRLGKLAILGQPPRMSFRLELYIPQLCQGLYLSHPWLLSEPV